MPGVPGAPIPKGVEPAPKGGEPKPVPLNKPADPEKRSGLSGDNRDEGTLARGKIEDGSTGAMNVAQVDLKGQPLPAVGAAPAGGSPLDPMPAPAKRPGPGAPVEEGATKYDVRTYRCKAEDTSFKVLSYRFYMSERYERALLFYNRTHPLVAEGVLIDPPRLKEGTTVFIPPLEILEQRHADVIPGLPVQRSASEAPSSRRGAPAGPEETRSVPVAVTPRPGAGPAPVNAVVRANAPASGEPKSYRVARGGEPMWQIAQRALGDARRWNEIYRLNPHLEPELPLREGTTVLLPADARIQ